MKKQLALIICVLCVASAYGMDGGAGAGADIPADVAALWAGLGTDSQEIVVAQHVVRQELYEKKARDAIAIGKKEDFFAWFLEEVVKDPCFYMQTPFHTIISLTKYALSNKNESAAKWVACSLVNRTSLPIAFGKLLPTERTEMINIFSSVMGLIEDDYLFKKEWLELVPRLRGDEMPAAPPAPKPVGFATPATVALEAYVLVDDPDFDDWNL